MRRWPRQSTVRATPATRAFALSSHLVLVVLVVLGSGCSSPRKGDASDALEANARVVRVVDGDTIVVSADGTEDKVRLIGINTPESVDRRRPVMCFGKKASEHMAELLPEGTPVRLERDVEPRDRYDRLLAYVYRASDALFVNLAMVQEGFAQQYTYPPNVAHADEFGDAQKTAREKNLGAWGGCDEPFEN